jgi:hypothetical protein
MIFVLFTVVGVLTLWSGIALALAGTIEEALHRTRPWEN